MIERLVVSKKRPKRKSALEKECDRALTEQIRRLLALPMNKRTHFLRVRHPSGGSHLRGFHANGKIGGRMFDIGGGNYLRYDDNFLPVAQ